MKAIIEADSSEHEYEVTFTDDHLDNLNFIDMIIKQKNEDYYESWTISIKDLYDAVALFESRRKREEV
jgi:hypothetical protein